MTGELKTIDQLELGRSGDGRDDRQRFSLEPVAARLSELMERDIPENLMGLDIGPKTLDRYRQNILGAKTVFWNGPMGLCEQKPWAEGSEGVARAMAESKAMTVVGGGDTTVLLEEKGLVGDMTHVSTSGGVGGGT